MRLDRHAATLGSFFILTLLAIAVFTLYSPSASAGSCTQRAENYSDPNTGQSWGSVWYCGNDSGAGMYAAPITARTSPTWIRPTAGLSVIGTASSTPVTTTCGITHRAIALLPDGKDVRRGAICRQSTSGQTSIRGPVYPNASPICGRSKWEESLTLTPERAGPLCGTAAIPAAPTCTATPTLPPQSALWIPRRVGSCAIPVA